MNILQTKEFAPTKAIAHAQAVQILAEMLATICYLEYFTKDVDGTGNKQTVLPSTHHTNEVISVLLPILMAFMFRYSSLHSQPNIFVRYRI